MLAPDHALPSRREHAQALLLAALCALLFLRSALLPGSALVPFAPQLLDVQLAEAEARGALDPAALARGAVGMGDKYFQSLCWDRVLHDRLANGELPRWTRDIGGGAPFVPQMAQPFHPSNALLLLLPSEQWYGWCLWLHQVLFGWFAYVFFRGVGCAHRGALFGIVLAVLGLWVQSKVHHNVIVSAALPVWPMLLATYRLTFGRRHGGADRLAAAGMLAVASGLSWLSGFVIVSLQASYLCVAMAAVGIVRMPAGERARAATAFGGALLLGAGIALANMAPIGFAWAESSRRAEFDGGLLAMHGLEPAHLLSLGWPDLLAHPIDHVYPGVGAATERFTRPPWSQLLLLERPLSPQDGSAYQGWVETAFAIGACGTACTTMAFARPSHRPLAWFFAAAALLAFGMATASQPWLAIARALPGLEAGDFRRCTFVVSIALVGLATLGADALADGRRCWPFCGLAGGVAAVSATAVWWLARHADPATFVDGMAALYARDTDHPLVRAVGRDAAAIAAAVRAAAAPGEVEHNHAALVATAARSLLVGVLALAAVRLRPSRRAVALLAVAGAELLHVGLGPVRAVPAADVRRVPAALEPVSAATPARGARPRLARLMPAASRLDQGLPGNFPGYLGIEDASCYSALAPRRTAEFFTAIEANRAGKVDVAYRTAGVGAFHDAASLAHPLCDLFGIRFVLSRVPLAPTAALLDRTPANTGVYRLYERTTTLPRATFVTVVDVLPDAVARLAALARPDRDVATRVVLEAPHAPVPVQVAPPRPATVALLEHADEFVRVSVDTDADGYLRLADPYDAGWRATVDGAFAEVFVADHCLRAVHVPRGRHEVRFTYDAPRVVWPPRIALAALCAALTLWWLGRRRALRSVRQP